MARSAAGEIIFYKEEASPCARKSEGGRGFDRRRVNCVGIIDDEYDFRVSSCYAHKETIQGDSAIPLADPTLLGSQYIYIYWMLLMVLSIFLWVFPCAVLVP